MNILSIYTAIMSRFSVSMNVSVSKKINAPKEHVWENIKTFEAQQKRSPRLIMERTAKTWIEGGTDGEIGSSSHRDGERIGSGFQRIDSKIAGERIDTFLQFLTPWKSKATCSMYLTEVDGSTEITWSMKSSLPWFLFWMKATTVSMIEQDYERGLNMLGTRVETGKLETETTFNGKIERPQLIGIGIKNNASHEQMGSTMATDFGILESFIKEHDIPTQGAFALYTKVDMKKRFYEFTSCVIVDSGLRGSLTLPDNLTWAEAPAGSYLHVTHTGDYAYLGNSRSAAYGGAYALKMKIDKHRPAYEHYISDPKTTDVEKWVTEIYVPIK